MKKLVFYLIGVLLLDNNLVGAHPNSISFSEITIHPDHIKYELRIILSEFITHAVPADDNGDEKLDGVELEKYKQEIYDYLNKGIKIKGSSSPYAFQVDSMTVSESGLPSITFHLTFRPRNQKVGSFTISCRIFEDVENHRSLAKITSGEETKQFVFTLDNQYERKVAGEDIRPYSLNRISQVRKTLVGLFGFIGVIGLLWLIRRNFLIRAFLRKSGQTHVNAKVDKKDYS